MIITMSSQPNSDDAYINISAVRELINFMFSKEAEISDENIEIYLDRLIDKYYQECSETVKGRARFLLAGAYVGVGLLCTEISEKEEVDRKH